MMKSYKISYTLLITYLCMATLFGSSCKIYKFTEATVDTDIKTVKVNFIENRARYINPQLSPRLTDKLRQKIVSQTKLSQTNADNADWEISGSITDYSFSTSVISNQQTTASRLSVTVHITKLDRKKEKTDEYDVNRSFEFGGNQSFQQAESALGEEMIRTLTDEIFNKLFSNW